MSLSSSSTITKSPRILLVEDEKALAIGISYNLDKRSYMTEVVDRGSKGLEVAQAKEFDLIILDVMLPDMDGFEICRRLREGGSRTPILMLTARAETENKIKGLRLGADDYLAKPFDLEELLTRVDVLLRRRRWDEEPRSAGSRFQLDEVEFDADELLLKGQGKQVTLTPIEAKLLQLLVSEKGHAIPRAQILKRVWGLHAETQTRTLDNFVMRLRHHLDDVGGSAQWIESVRGVGYRFTNL